MKFFHLTCSFLFLSLSRVHLDSLFTLDFEFCGFIPVLLVNGYESNKMLKSHLRLIIFFFIFFLFFKFIY